MRTLRGRRGTEMDETESGTAVSLPAHDAGGRRVCIVSVISVRNEKRCGFL